MNTRWQSLVLGAVLAATSAWGANVTDLLVGKPKVNVITFTELTPAGKLRTAPTPQAPVYYVPATSGFKELGGSVAGEAPLPNEEAIRTISKVLAGQGYLPVTAGTPAPRLLLVFTWGTLNVDEVDIGGQSVQINRQEMLNFVGARSLGLTDNLPPPPGRRSSFLDAGLSIAEADRFLDLGSEDLYVASVSAYDLGSAKNSRRELLWITRISCPSSGLVSLKNVLPTMMAVAAPHIGRETHPPVWVNVPEKYKPEVKIHDLQMLEYLENGALPVLEPKGVMAPAKSPK